jgi:RimJ/RimL family protein N-acetyltransferase
MKHDFIIQGFGIRLRPVYLGDAAFIVSLRNSDHAVGRVGDTSISVEAQEAWLSACFERPGDFYFIIETMGGTPVGTYSIYGVTGTSAEMGRWVVLPNVPAAVPSAIILIDFAFGRLGLTELRGTVVGSNFSVQSFNRKIGCHVVSTEKGGRLIGGVPVDIVHTRQYAREWPEYRQRLLPLAALAEKAVIEWDRKQHAGNGLRREHAS